MTLCSCGTFLQRLPEAVALVLSTEGAESLCSKVCLLRVFTKWKERIGETGQLCCPVSSTTTRVSGGEINTGESFSHTKTECLILTGICCPGAQVCTCQKNIASDSEAYFKE